jgi:hypothetical protein
MPPELNIVAFPGVWKFRPHWTDGTNPALLQTPSAKPSPKNAKEI